MKQAYSHTTTQTADISKSDMTDISEFTVSRATRRMNLGEKNGRVEDL